MIKAINHKLEIAKKEKRKKKIIEKEKTETIVAKRHKNRREISLSSEKGENYDSDTTNDINLDQAKSKYWILKLDRYEAIND